MRTRSNPPKYLMVQKWLDQNKSEDKSKDEISMILSNLYLTSRRCVSIATIKKYNICSIVSIGEKLKQDEISFLRDYLFLDILDSSEKAHLMKNALKYTRTFITSNIAKGPVLVHCHLGISRSPTIVIDYLVSIGQTPEEALKHVKFHRRCIYPNLGYLQILFGDSN